MPKLELLVKKMALLLSDSVSGQLQVQFTCRFFGKKMIPFQSIQKLESDYFTFSLYNSDKAPILVAVDAPIIHRLSNRLLGAEWGEAHGGSTFSSSDYALGNHLIHWTQTAFRKQGVTLSLGKIATSPTYFHIYLPDELVWQVAFEVKIGPDQAGMIFICFDRDFHWEDQKEPLP